MWLQRQAPQKHHVSVPAQPKKTTRMSAVIIFVTVTSCHHLTSTAPDHGCKTSIWQPAQNWVQRLKQILHPNFYDAFYRCSTKTQLWCQTALKRYRQSIKSIIPLFKLQEAWDGNLHFILSFPVRATIHNKGIESKRTHKHNIFAWLSRSTSLLQLVYNHKQLK